MKQLKIPNNVNENKTISMTNNNIKDILSEILNFQSETINKNNEDKLKELLNTADVLIVECHNTQTFKINRNNNFSRLVYEYQRLKLKYESYITNKQIETVTKEYQEVKSETRNLVYNILGFIASFSIVSAAVSAIQNINGTLNIVLFMVFSAFILLTTLIGLHNFYKSNDENAKGLQNNYFLWKMTAGIVVFLVLLMGIKYVKDNKDNIFNYIDERIENIVENKIEKTRESP